MDKERTTANGKHCYDKEYYGVSLNDYVDMIHKKMCNNYNWKYNPLKPYSFSYENLINSVGLVFNKYGNKTINTVDEIADLVHEGWITNYIYWRDNSPFLNNSRYITPLNKLGDEKRNKCARTKYRDLPKEEKEKDFYIAKILYKVIQKNSEKKKGKFSKDKVYYEYENSEDISDEKYVDDEINKNKSKKKMMANLKVLEHTINHLMTKIKVAWTYNKSSNINKSNKKTKSKGKKNIQEENSSEDE